MDQPTATGKYANEPGNATHPRAHHVGYAPNQSTTASLKAATHGNPTTGKPSMPDPTCDTTLPTCTPRTVDATEDEATHHPTNWRTDHSECGHGTGEPSSYPKDRSWSKGKRKPEQSRFSAGSIPADEGHHPRGLPITGGPNLRHSAGSDGYPRSASFHIKIIAPPSDLELCRCRLHARSAVRRFREG